MNFSRSSVQSDELRVRLNGCEDVPRGRRGLRVFRRDEVHLGHQRPQTTSGNSHQRPQTTSLTIINTYTPAAVTPSPAQRVNSDNIPFA